MPVPVKLVDGPHTFTNNANGLTGPGVASQGGTVLTMPPLPVPPWGWTPPAVFEWNPATNTYERTVGGTTYTLATYDDSGWVSGPAGGAMAAFGNYT